VALIAFAALATVAVGSALGLLLRRNPIHGALFLVVNLGAVAGLYLMMGAEFLAAAQVIVYAGAIMVLFVFAIMVLIPGREETGPDPRRPWRLLGVPLAGLLLAQLGAVLLLRRAPAGAPAAPAPAAAPPPVPAAAPAGGVEALGRQLLTDYLLPFELTSVVLLAAMVGVLLLARRRA